MTTKIPIQLKIENIEEVTVWCNACLEENKKIPAIIYCQNCQENLCESCDLIHQNRRFQNHQRDPLQKNNTKLIITENCPIHKRYKLSRYCKTCHTLICSEGIFDHTTHETIKFDESLDFFKDLIIEQKKISEKQLQNICESFEQSTNFELETKKKQKTIINDTDEFYLSLIRLIKKLQENEKKITNSFFEQIYNLIQQDKNTLKNSKSVSEKSINQFNELEKCIAQSDSFQFFKLYANLELQKKYPKLKVNRTCKKQNHHNLAYEYFCIDHKELLCNKCVILYHRKCNHVVNLKEGYKKIQNEIEELINQMKEMTNKKKEFVNTIQNEKIHSLKEKKKNIEIIKKNYQEINESTQFQFKNMIEEISIQQNAKYLKLNTQLTNLKQVIQIFEKSEKIIKDIEICKKYENYLDILLNYLKLEKLKPILTNNKNNQLICYSKFIKKNVISNDLKDNLKNWKLNMPFDLNNIQINIPSNIKLENKLQFSILLKNECTKTDDLKYFDPKVEILKSKSNEIMTEITKFQEVTNKKLIGDYLFQEEGKYQIHFFIGQQECPKSPFYLHVKGIFVEESEILQRENNLKFNQILEKWVQEAGCNSNLHRRFNSRTDGWKYQTFHKMCDKKGRSIVLIKLKNESLFGGFAAVDWDSKGGWKQTIGNKSFLFSLISLDPNFKEPLKMSVYYDKQKEFYCNGKFGIYFGSGRSGDLYLGHGSDNMKNNDSTHSNLGDNYLPPFGYKFGSNKAKNFLAGSYKNWNISQIEVFCER
ncbi:hypothetical protein M0813_11526 [Anaeramoeba flamelloides]|uniref:B box-type domain-containing protein n=1 Tax=Anaeramoeba flamelloides TaxID=1746091 RepID=A0ABQ8ZEY0_9EUKA|nr:hypothetical protein M0813_11526 [Anaeramoeba flamelloides]